MLDATFKFYHADSTGTCVLVSRDDKDKNLYLVTSAHVLEGTKGDTAIVVLRKVQDDGSFQRHDLPSRFAAKASLSGYGIPKRTSPCSS